MTDLQNSMFEAMKVFSDYSESHSKATVTIESIVTKIVDAALGEYMVSYLGNEFIAFAQNNGTYNVDDKVFVLIPEGNFSKTKIILSLITPSIETFINDSETIKYNDVTDNLIESNILNSLIKMTSYEITDEKTHTYPIFTDKDKIPTFLQMLNRYKDKTFSLNMSVLTSLKPEQQMAGNYGIRLDVPVTSDNGAGTLKEEIKSFTLDVGNMLGNPYNLTTWTNENVYFNIDKHYTISGVPTLSYFCYDFNLDPVKAADAKANGTEDILLNDISFKVVEALDLSKNNGYCLSVKASEGLFFSNNLNFTKILTPVLRVNGVITKTTADKCKFYWFKEDVSVKINTDSYCNYGGIGWKCLNSKEVMYTLEDGTTSYDWDGKKETLEVKKDDIHASARYKLVLIYNNVEVSSIITLKNLDSEDSIELKTTTSTTTYIKDKGYVNLIATTYIDEVTDKTKYRNCVFYSWMRVDQTGTPIFDEDNFFQVVRHNDIITKDNKSYYETEVRFPVSSIEDFNAIYCSCKFKHLDEDNSEDLIGTDGIVLFTSSELSFGVTINNDDIIYKYDTDGDSPAGTAYDGPSTSKVTSIAALTYTVFKEDGSELTETEYSYVKHKWAMPKDSLFIPIDTKVGGCTEDANFYYFEGWGKGDNYSLGYKIASRFNVSKANKPLSLTIEFDGNTYTTNASISFIKEGMNGSNGTAYAARLVAGGNTASTSYPYADLDGEGVAKKQKLLYNINEGKNGELYIWDYDNNKLVKYSSLKRKIFAQVYENSELLQYKIDYDIEYSMFDEKYTKPFLQCSSTTADGGVYLQISNDTKRLPTNDTLENAYPNVVQAKITVKNGNASVLGSKQVLYAYYPIELIVTALPAGIDIENNQIYVPRLDGGFAEVMYASDGTNPSWDETKLFEFDIFTNDYFSPVLKVSNHLNLIDTDKDGLFINGDGTFTVKPDNKYDSGDASCYVHVDLTNPDENTLDTAIELFKDLIAEQQDIKINANLDKQYLEKLADKYNSLDLTSKVSDVENLFLGKNGLIAKLNIVRTKTSTLLYDIQTKISNLLEDETDKKSALQIFETQVTEILEEQAAAYDEVLKYGNPGTDIRSLGDKQIPWSTAIYTQWEELLGPTGGAETFLVEVEDVNLAITDYDTSLAAFVSSPSLSADVVNYQNLVSSLTELAETNITATSVDGVTIIEVSPQYKVYRTAILNAIKELPTIYSYKSLKAIIDTIYVEYLCASFDRFNGSILISDATNREFENIKADADETIKNLNKVLTAYLQMRNAVDCVFSYTRPIIMYYNRYEMSNINGWDGNKTDVNDGYILAPQVGAGRKEEDNSFTGVVIGQKNITNGTKDSKIGLFGFNHGDQTIFLDSQDGSALFGKQGAGQICIDPRQEHALLYSGNYFDASLNNFDNSGKVKNTADKYCSGEGMMIDLSEPRIRFGSGNFEVTKEGHVTAKGGGTIAGWEIGDETLVGSTIINGVKKTTTLNKNGTITCHNLIASETGYIAGWKIDGNELRNEEGTLRLKSTGEISGGIGDTNRWIVNKEGKATFYDIQVLGGTLAGWKVRKEGGWYGLEGSDESTGFWTSLYSNGMLLGGAPSYYADPKQTFSWSINPRGLIICTEVYLQPAKNLDPKNRWWDEIPKSLYGDEGLNIGTIIAYLHNLAMGTHTWRTEVVDPQIANLVQRVQALENNKANHGTYTVSNNRVSI